ncbi:MAG: metallophosphoesterase [Deltaproteobacteria bacterium]|nr:metallophosphoesterase [Deltaproteobacteria bacterium]
MRSRFLLALPTVMLVACAGGELGLTGSACTTDNDCDPGDVCSGGECAQALSVSGVIGLSPKAAAVDTEVGVKPSAVTFTITNLDKTNHNVHVVCTGSLVPTPATVQFASKATANVSVQAPAPAVDGTSNATCNLNSSSGATTWGTFTLTVSTNGPIDAGTPDAGHTDGGGTDAGSTDAGTHDGGSGDAGTHDGGSGDGGSGGTDAGSGPIGPTGGTVDLLDFVITGDTRPPTCQGLAQYPSSAHAQIVKSMASVKAQFAIDLGDHMYVCDNVLADAQAQMNLYTSALANFPTPFFMTMGNHECNVGTDCSAHTTDANYTAYLGALKSVSRETLPYYALQIETRLGRATVAVIADNFFDATAQSWLESTLADADANSKYTFIVKHHPVTGSRTGPTGPLTVLQKHKYSLILTAHNHNYSHDTSSFSGRSVVCGLGGADTSHTGFCRVQQQADGSLKFTHYDASANPSDTWSVTAR